MTTSLILMVIAGLCVMVAIFVIVAALTTKEETDGQRTLIRVTREVNRTRIIDEEHLPPTGARSDPGGPPADRVAADTS